MTKLLNTTTTNSISLNSTLHAMINAAVSFCREALKNGHSDALADRLRYDMGALDLNPDCRQHSAAPRQNMDHLRSI